MVGSEALPFLVRCMEGHARLLHGDRACLGRTISPSHPPFLILLITVFPLHPGTHNSLGLSFFDFLSSYRDAKLGYGPLEFIRFNETFAEDPRRKKSVLVPQFQDKRKWSLLLPLWSCYQESLTLKTTQEKAELRVGQELSPEWSCTQRHRDVLGCVARGGNGSFPALIFFVHKTIWISCFATCNNKKCAADPASL